MPARKNNPKSRPPEFAAILNDLDRFMDILMFGSPMDNDEDRLMELLHLYNRKND